ncbi:MAG: gamma carbonic anhydrase family protein [Chloroflexi bacterium]|nr:gamma carbonic anhydrase family protein [Chloroflexota bacterium]
MPRIADAAFIAESALVVGDVEIGEYSSVWPGAVIRGDVDSIKIGHHVHVQDNSVIHNDQPLVIGDNILIGHCAIVHCKRVGSNVLIGNNCTILDGAEIGDECIIGSNAMVTEGMKVPDGSFVVGVPAQIKKRVTDEQMARLARGIESYTNKSQKYKSEGF